MRTEKLIVFGDDGSPAADDAWRWIDGRSWPGWRLEVVTAQMPAIGPPPDGEEAELHAWEPTHPRRPSPSTLLAGVEHLVATIDPRVVLWRPSADLVVVGPRGQGLLKTLHLGSTTEYLLHHPAAPLVVARAPRTIESVLLCVDGSPHADRATRTLASMPWIDGVIVEVLGVEDGGYADLDRATERACSLLSAARAKPEARIARGTAAPTILEEAEATDADLISMGSRGLSVLRQLTAGSVVSAVVRAARCSVMVSH